jgi:hypothetical protein
MHQQDVSKWRKVVFSKWAINACDELAHMRGAIHTHHNMCARCANSTSLLWYAVYFICSEKRFPQVKVKATFFRFFCRSLNCASTSRSCKSCLLTTLKLTLRSASSLLGVFLHGRVFLKVVAVQCGTVVLGSFHKICLRTKPFFFQAWPHHHHHPTHTLCHTLSHPTLVCHSLSQIRKKLCPHTPPHFVRGPILWKLP